jgi:hypothetical protein
MSVTVKISDDVTVKISDGSGHPIARLLQFLAPIIEAAGTWQRAERLGLMGSFGPDVPDVHRIRKIVPVSRGGLNIHPDADRDWYHSVVLEIHANNPPGFLQRQRDEIDALERLGGT